MYATQNLIYLTRCARRPEKVEGKSGRFWKPWEDRFLLAYKEVFVVELAQILNRTPSAIHARIKLHENRPEDTLA